MKLVASSDASEAIAGQFTTSFVRIPAFEMSDATKLVDTVFCMTILLATDGPLLTTVNSKVIGRPTTPLVGPLKNIDRSADCVTASETMPVLVVVPSLTM